MRGRGKAKVSSSLNPGLLQYNSLRYRWNKRGVSWGLPFDNTTLVWHLCSPTRKRVREKSDKFLLICFQWLEKVHSNFQSGQQQRSKRWAQTLLWLVEPGKGSKCQWWPKEPNKSLDITCTNRQNIHFLSKLNRFPDFWEWGLNSNELQQNQGSAQYLDNSLLAALSLGKVSGVNSSQGQFRWPGKFPSAGLAQTPHNESAP